MNCVSISYDGGDSWQLDGAAVGATRSFATLAEALACARELTHAAETLIELDVSGFHACVHQERGWPSRIYTPSTAAA
jgi:hypothetical protein